MAHTTDRIILIGTSTGGTQAFRGDFAQRTAHLPGYSGSATHARKIYGGFCPTVKFNL